MSPFHCGSCGYLSAYHAMGFCPGLKTKKWTDRDPIDGTVWRQIMARDAAARIRAYEIDPEVARNGAAEARRKLFDRATRIVLGIEDDSRQLVIDVRPRVPARPPRSKAEFAGTNGKQAVGLGSAAVKRGFQVSPLYWQAGDGAEGCAVKGHRPGFAFVATWIRPAGKSGDTAGWRADVAYGWDPADSRAPTKMTHTDLEGLIK